jgi:flagellar biosynthetic protein FliQ
LCVLCDGERGLRLDAAASFVAGTDAYSFRVAFQEDRMSGADILDIAIDGIWTMIFIAAPMMLVGLTVGVVIALFQALTQIQEMTLVFVPKILAIFVTLLVALPFMGATMDSFMTRLIDKIVTGG